MDSKEVNKHIRAIIWPALKEQGFDTFDPRTAWRHQDDRIDVINFQSYNTYHAGVLKVTPFSFSVNLGCCLTTIPFHTDIKVKNGFPLPKEYQCDFRGRLKRTFLQFRNRHKDIWYIDNKGKSLGKSLEDVLRQIRQKALPWFQRLTDKAEVMRILCSENEQMGDLWGFGRNPSPHRSYLTGYLALSLGDTDLAIRKLQEVVDSGCFTTLFTDVQGALKRSNTSLNLTRGAGAPLAG